LLTRDYKNWNDLLEQAAQTVQIKLAEQGPLKDRTWGERNTAAICHPLAAALPAFAKSVLCMPPDQLEGDADMALVVSPNFGASERMVVSPGREQDGIIHMPGRCRRSGVPAMPIGFSTNRRLSFRAKRSSRWYLNQNDGAVQASASKAMLRPRPAIQIRERRVARFDRYAAV
jgi:hypothetical protein